ncbi:hypothetical protein GGR57DRAFT_491347 [Xylariaceae sp. FL1272]|nr:hypothetical protein GGR57DRAFT_491347 [Xylariaceae sp. FL1272]
MSGIKVVGLVLRAISLLITALEHPQDGKSAVSTWRRHVRVIQSFTRNLNTCETLLGGIVAPRRLDHMYNTFEETVKDMLFIIEELKMSLGVDAEGQSDTSMGGAVKRNVMRASLVIKRSSYKDALQRLITQNQTLETIVIGSLRLESSRQKRSRGRYFNVFRRVLCSIYKSIHLGLCEHGQLGHGLSLQLLTPQLSIRGDEENAIRKGTFRLRKSKRETKPTPSSRHFSRFHKNPAPGRLCQALSMGTPSPMICSYVDDPSSQEFGRFGVSYVNENCNNSDLSFVYIREMMEASTDQRRLNTPSLPEKLLIASAIASAILQLHNMPWLSRSMTSHTLYFAQFDGVACFSQVYISSTEQHCRHEPRCSGPRPSGNVPSQVFDYTTEEGFCRVRDMLSKVAMVSGQEYCSAVGCCLKLAFGYPRLDLEQEEVRQQIFADIATPIEASLESSRTLTITQGGLASTY